MYNRKTVKLDPVLRRLMPLAVIIESKHPKALLLGTTDFYDCYADVCVCTSTRGGPRAALLWPCLGQSFCCWCTRLADSQASGDSVLGLQGRTTAWGILGILEIQTRALTRNSLAVFFSRDECGVKGYKWEAPPCLRLYYLVMLHELPALSW